MFCLYCVNLPNSKNKNSSFRKGSNKYFLLAIETQDKRHIQYNVYFSLVFIIIIKKVSHALLWFLMCESHVCGQMMGGRRD